MGEYAEWFVKGICACYPRVPFAFLTDAGTGFDKNCLRHMKRLMDTGLGRKPLSKGRRRGQTLEKSLGWQGHHKGLFRGNHRFTGLATQQ